jgi:polysaccharide deacetylase 2 family uncharacterized protein YibQ
MHRRTFLRQSAGWLTAGVMSTGLVPRLASGANSTARQAPPRVALIIDDIGHSFPRARLFLDLKIPLTYSILPRMANSQNLAVEIHRQGHEIMLHQPMEPYDSGFDPGPGALYVGDGRGRIQQIVAENMADVPFAVGLNNHMGSRFTECPREIQTVLRLVQGRGLYFVDSLTSSHSMAHKIARTLNIASASRNYFLDTSRDVPAIERQLRRLRDRASRCGRAIGIGHPYPETAEALGCFLKRLRPDEVSFVHASEILQG